MTGCGLTSTSAAGEDDGESLALHVRFQKATLPNLVQWKMMGEGTYVLGLEPANRRAGSRSLERARGTLQILQPGGMRTFNIEIDLSENK